MRFLMRYANGIFVGRERWTRTPLGRRAPPFDSLSVERETGEINPLPPRRHSFLSSSYSRHFPVKASSSRADCGAICEHSAKVASARAFANTRIDKFGPF